MAPMEPWQRPLSRRAFIRTSFWGLLLLATVGLLPLACRRRSLYEGKLKVLGPAEGETLLRATEALLPQSRSLPPASELSCIEAVDRLIQPISRGLKGQIKLMVRFLEWAPILFLFSWHRFSQLPVAKRREVLAFFAASRFALLEQVFTGAKALGLAGYYSQAEAWEAIAYDGPWVGRVKVAPIEPPLASYDP